MVDHPVLIVGGGLGGLTLSLCLAKVGIPSIIFERRSELTESGAGIQLSPNCLRVYDYLGMMDAISEIAHEPSHIEFRDWRHNRVVSELNLSDFEEKLGFPYFAVHRGQLVRLLRSRASEVESIALYLDREIDNYVRTGLIRHDRPYKEFYDNIKIEFENSNYPKLHPELFTRTANGQIRLAHMVRTRVKAYRIKYNEELSSKLK